MDREIKDTQFISDADYVKAQIESERKRLSRAENEMGQINRKISLLNDSNLWEKRLDNELKKKDKLGLFDEIKSEDSMDIFKKSASIDSSNDYETIRQ